MLLSYIFFSVAPFMSAYMSGSVIITELLNKIWLPIELNSSIEIVIVYIVERLVNCYVCSLIVALSNLYVFKLTLISAEFKILKVDFMNFADDYEDLCTEEMECDKSISFRLKKNIQNHQELLR